MLVQLVATLAVVVPISGMAQSGWEFRVCSQPYNYPASSHDNPGFENKIAQILADELGAELTYTWVTFDAETIELTLHAGECDAVIGIGEGVSGVESTVPFLRAPYTFVSRTEDNLEITSLDDPLLAELTVGTYPAGIPSLALRNRGLQDNVREYAPVASPAGFDRDRAVLDALIDGEIDVAIVYGPAAAARGELEPGLLHIVPVTPEMDFGTSLLQLFRIFTIGVRPHDVAFRERLDIALAARWEEIQAVIASYGVPQLDIIRPLVAPEIEPGRIRIGVVVPSETAAFHRYETEGAAARRGAELAKNYIALQADRHDAPFQVLIASAPSDEAAVRAAERLAVTESIIALAGGFGRTQAEELSRIADERNLVFFNIAASDEALRGRLCSPSTFHVEASTSMYADAALLWFAERGLNDWYLVHEATEEGETFSEYVRMTLAAEIPDSRVLGTSAVEPGQLGYRSEIRAIRDAAPDVVLLHVGAADLIAFYGQFEGQVIGATVTNVPSVQAQTREFLYRLGQTAPTSATAPRPMLWEAGLVEGDAGSINEAYRSRTGELMEASAWAAYAAILLTFEAASAGAAADTGSLIEFLTNTNMTFDLGKGVGLSFRHWDHQLRQPLYMVQVNPDAPWGRRASSRLEIAEVLGVIPDAQSSEGPDTGLDRLGIGPERSECAF